MRPTGPPVDHRLREVADELTADQRLVLACQIALDMDCQEFCARFGWSAEKYRRSRSVPAHRSASLSPTTRPAGAARAWRTASPPTSPTWPVASSRSAVRCLLANCPACPETACELERMVRGGGALLPLPPVVDPEVVHRFGAVGRVFGHLIPFWETGESGAAKAGAAAAAGGGGIAAGGSMVGLGAAKLGVTALCVAGVAGGYVVCDHVGLLRGALLRERRHIGRTTANAAREAPPKRRAPSLAVTLAPAPITHTIASRPLPVPRASTKGHPLRLRRLRIRPATSSASRAGGEAPPSSSSTSPCARAASAGAPSGPPTPSAGRTSPAASGHQTST